MFPHPVFQVAGHACIEHSFGFSGHDVKGGLFHDRCTVMDSHLRGNDVAGVVVGECDIGVKLNLP